jgi:uncharacterized protein YbjQ (UPF0145 family)
MANPHGGTGRMLLTTTEIIPGQEYEIVALVKGNTVQAKHVGRDFMAGLKNIVGGELKGYTELLSEARAEATNRMVLEARALRADAIVGIRYSTANITQAAAEVMVFGTAVRYR